MRLAVTSLAVLALLCGDAAAQRIYSIWYQGFECRKIQADSVFHPANEIFIVITAVGGLDRSPVTHKYPQRSAFYPKITAGAKRPAKGLLWRGREQPVGVNVTMWEHDDGKDTVPVIVSLTREAAELAASRGGSKALRKGMKAYKRADRAAEMGRDAGDPVMDAVGTIVIDVPDAIEAEIAKNLVALVGGGNDPMGSSSLQFQAGNLRHYASQKPGRPGYGPFTSHVATRHRNYGADCSVYLTVSATGSDPPPVARQPQRPPPGATAPRPQPAPPPRIVMPMPQNLPKNTYSDRDVVAQAPPAAPAMLWGAIAAGSGLVYGQSFAYASRTEAEQRALGECAGQGQGCELMISYTDCAAYYKDSEGAFGWSHQASLADAEQRAHGTCAQNGGRACQRLAVNCASGRW